MPPGPRALDPYMTETNDVTSVPTIVLNDGKTIPALGFGVFQVPDDETQEAVSTALKTGYRSIDTAKIYGNEVGVGRAIAESGIAREDLYITTKLWNDDQGYDSTLAAFDASLDKLGLEYLDLYLIHWPVPSKDLYVETFKAFQKLKADGRVRSIGVSNFTIENLERVIGETGEVPVLNQIELHPQVQPSRTARLPHRQGNRDGSVEPARTGNRSRRPPSSPLSPTLMASPRLR